MKRAFVLFAILFGTVIFYTHPSVADGVLAVGAAPGAGGGFVYGWSTSKNAQTESVRFCKGLSIAEINELPPNASKAKKACRVVGTFHNQCMAVALDSVSNLTGYGWAFAADLSTAKSNAIAKCNSMAASGHPPCFVQQSRCDGTAK